MNPSRITALVFLALDVVATLFVFNIVSHFRGLWPLEHFIVDALKWPLAAIVFSLYLIDGYKVRTDMLSVDYTSQHAIALLGALVATLLFTFAFNPAGYELQSSRIVIAFSFLALIPVTLGYRRLIYARGLGLRGAQCLVFLGDRPSCEAFRAECQRMGMAQRIVFTVASEDAAGAPDHGERERLRLIQEVLDEVQRGRLVVEAIVLRESADELSAAIARRLVDLYFGGVPTFTLELFHQVYWQKIPLYRVNQTWLFQEGFQIAREPVFERLKRATDLGLSALGLLLASPLILLGALAVWLGDRGPVFFFQTRIGKNHQPFRLVKLRTMRVDPADGDLYTRPDDPRITRLGHFLRASRFDELPQLWNVLRGDMSLIGPRAEWDRLVENYEREIPCYYFRHLVKPGITGWAQVNYPYGASMEDTLRKLEYDLYYIRHFSFKLDAAIILKTIHTMLFGKGR